MAFGKPKKEKPLKTVGTKDTKEEKAGVRDSSAIDAAIRDIRTKFGDEAIMTLVLDMVWTVKRATSTMNPNPNAQRKIHRLIPIPG